MSNAYSSRKYRHCPGAAEMLMKRMYAAGDDWSAATLAGAPALVGKMGPCCALFGRFIVDTVAEVSVPVERTLLLGAISETVAPAALTLSPLSRRLTNTTAEETRVGTTGGVGRYDV